MPQYQNGSQTRKAYSVGFWKAGQRVRYKKLYRKGGVRVVEFTVSVQVSLAEVHFKEKPDSVFHPMFFEPI